MMSDRSDGRAEFSAAKWRFTDSVPRSDDRAPGEPALDAAWLHMQLLHTPFRATEQKDYLKLVDGLRSIEALFFGSPELKPYYDECMRSETEPTSDCKGADTPTADPPTPPQPVLEWRIRHVAMLQIQLMEDVFYALQLDRFANAPDNRGWMNLFRRWGRSATFKCHFAAIAATFSGEFVRFCELYLHDLGTVDRQPVPHRWDHHEKRSDYGAMEIPGLYDTVAWEAARRDLRARRRGNAVQEAAVKTVGIPRPVPGVFLDDGIKESAAAFSLTPEAERGAHGSSGTPEPTQSAPTTSDASPDARASSATPE